MLSTSYSSRLHVLELTSAESSGLTGAANSGPPAGRSPTQPLRPCTRTSAAAESAEPCACLAPASTRRPRQ
eukprot:2152752-Alexandrium_andersonii.AAC.1